MRKIFPIIIILIVASLIWLINRPNQVIAISEEAYLVVEDEVFTEDRPVF